MRIFSKREQFARDISILLRYCTSLGYGVTFGEAYRTKEQQALYVEAKKSKVKVSQHQKRLGMDLHIWDEETGRYYITDKQWREVGEYWEQLNTMNRWGGRFGLKLSEYKTKIGWDRFHFERRK